MLKGNLDYPGKGLICKDYIKSVDVEYTYFPSGMGDDYEKMDADCII